MSSVGINVTSDCSCCQQLGSFLLQQFDGYWNFPGRLNYSFPGIKINNNF